MALSDYLDEKPGGTLSDQDSSYFETLPQLYYADGTPFNGRPKVIVFRDPISYYDENGLDLYPLERLR